jgi:hypothetical protein
MLVWVAPSAGGRTTGALYDPVRDRWTPIARGPALAANRSGPVWTGAQLVAWNGTGTGGIAYAPATNSWSTLPAGAAGPGRPPGRGDGLDRPRGGDLERLAPPYRDGAAYRPATGT